MTYEAPTNPPEPDYDEEALMEAASKLAAEIEAVLPRWLLEDGHFLEVLLDCCQDKIGTDWAEAEEARLEAAEEANAEAANAAVND